MASPVFATLAQAIVRTHTVHLKISFHSRKLVGFANLDFSTRIQQETADPLTLPLSDDTVTSFYCDNTLQQLPEPNALSFLRECRRVLDPNGRLHILTSGPNRVGECRSREIENVLERLIGDAGLSYLGRSTYSCNSFPAFAGLEPSGDSRVVVEASRTQRRITRRDELVSVLIPAYNPRFFECSLASAVNQNFDQLEIVVCDDGHGDDIRRIVDHYAAHDERIRYFKNERNLGARENYTKCFELARGNLIKFLNDDDLLQPDCVSRMVPCLRQFPDVTLVTSRRQRIDGAGHPRRNRPATVPPVKQDSWIDGVTLAHRLLEENTNIVGEPTTVLFRKNDLINPDSELISFGGRAVHWNVDLAMWLTLLSKGNAIYLIEKLSCFRVHPQQQQLQKGARKLAQRANEQMAIDGKRMGLWFPGRPTRLVTRPLSVT